MNNGARIVILTKNQTKVYKNQWNMRKKNEKKNGKKIKKTEKMEKQ